MTSPRFTIGRPTARGVTLMETVVVIGVMSVLMLIITQIFLINYDIFEKQMRRTDNETGAILAAKTISQMARGASAIMTSQVIGGTAYASSDAALVLKLPAINASGQILPGVYDHIAFYRDGVTPTKIFAATEAGTGSARQNGNRLITAYNQTLVFRYGNPDLTKANRVSVYLVNSQTRRETTLTTRAWTSIFLRNY